jgi:hypothetical protein
MVECVRTNADIRRANLVHLVTEYGGVANLASTIDRSPSQVSQWLNASVDFKSGKPRSIGNASARHIERSTGRPEGWLDQDRSTNDTAQVNESRPIVGGPPRASAKTRRALARIANAVDDGRLTEADINLLEQIADRLARKD